MKIKLAFLGGLDKYTGLDNVGCIEVKEGTTLSELMDNYDIGKKETKIFLVNGESRRLNYTLQEGDNVRVFPVLGGG